MPQAEIKQVDLKFPAKGILEDAALTAMPDGTSPLAMNVRGFDIRVQRERGCKRIGHAKWIPDRQLTSKIDLIALSPKTVTAAEYITSGIWSGNNFFAGQTPPGPFLFPPGPLIDGTWVWENYESITDPTYVQYQYNLTSARKMITSTSSYGLANGIVLKNQGSDTMQVLGTVDTGTASSFHVTSGTINKYIWGGTLIIGLGDTYGFFSDFPDGGKGRSIYITSGNNTVNGYGTTAYLYGQDTDGNIYNTGVHIGTGDIQTGSTFTFNIKFTPDNVVVTLGGAVSFTYTFANNIGAFNPVPDFHNLAGRDGIVSFDDENMPTEAVYNMNVTFSSRSYRLVEEQIAYAQGGNVYLGTLDNGFTLVDASGLSPNTAYHQGDEISMTGAYGAFWLVDGTNPSARSPLTPALSPNQRPRTELSPPAHA